MFVAGAQNPGATVVELGAAIPVDRDTVAEMISRMVDTGFSDVIARTTIDARARSTSPTAAWTYSARCFRTTNVMETVLEPLPLEYRPLFVKCLRLMAGLDENPASNSA